MGTEGDVGENAEQKRDGMGERVHATRRFLKYSLFPAGNKDLEKPLTQTVFTI